MPRWVAITSAMLLALAGVPATAQALTPQEQLGKSIFFDERLSLNQNQSCAACHAPEVGWTGPDEPINSHGAVYEGSIPARFGNRKPPSSAYATPSPILHRQRQGGGLFVGGNFWDGRATGEKLGNPAADQAQGPFLNPLEQALPDSACVVHRVCTASGYPVSFEAVWGAGTCAIAWPGDVETACSSEGGTVFLSQPDRATSEQAYDRIALSIAAFEASAESNAFTSKLDAYLARMTELSETEKRGLNLFRGKAKCARCHVVTKGPRGAPPLLTDFTYDNLGFPKNPENPFYAQTDFNPAGALWIDLGLGGFLQSRMDYAAYASENLGLHKVPTLRNVDRRPAPGFVKAYGHNGYFKSLKRIVHFYNTQNVLPTCATPVSDTETEAQGCWPLPELALNMNIAELGNLGLSEAEEDAIVAFLGTLSDGWLAAGSGLSRRGSQSGASLEDRGP